MAKKATKKSVAKKSISAVRIADIIAILSSIWFMNSISLSFSLNNTDSVNMRDIPAYFALIIGLLAVAYSTYAKKRLSFSTSFCIGVLFASLFIWYLGVSQSVMFF